MKIVKSLEDSSLLIKVVSDIIKIEAKEQKVGFLSMLLDTLRASLIGNLVTGTGEGALATRQRRGIIRACSDFQYCF